MSDRRSGRIAVVTTTTLDAPSTAPGSPAARLIETLERDGWGLVQLPPASLRGPARHRALAIVVDQLEDWLASGYRISLFLADSDGPATLRRLRRAMSGRALVWAAEPGPSPGASAVLTLRREHPR